MQNTTSKVTPATATGDETHGLVGLRLGTCLACGATPVAAAVANEDDAFAVHKARLTEELLATALRINALGKAAISVCEEMPDAAYTDKVDLFFLSKICICGSQFFAQLANDPNLLSHGGALAKEMRLQGHEFFIEFSLKSRGSLLVALPKHGPESLKGRHDA